MSAGRTFLGYRRTNGQVGCRNHVIILPVDDISNAAAEAVARVVQGTMALPHPYGRLQFGPDLEMHFRTLIGTGANPNVAAAVVIGIEPNWTRRVAEAIAATGKPVAAFSIEGKGDLKIIEEASRVAVQMVGEATAIQREQIKLQHQQLKEQEATRKAMEKIADMPAVPVYGLGTAIS